jgi:hypothetical protein
MRLTRLPAAMIATALLLAAIAGPTSATPARTMVTAHHVAAANARAADALEYTVPIVSYDTWYTGTTFSVVGEVRNDTALPVKSVRIYAMALAADDSVVAQGFDYIMFATLDPGEYGSFRIDAPLTGRIDYDRVWVEDWRYTTQASNHYFSATGTHTVVDANTTRAEGSIQNLNRVAAQDLRVVATVYDPAGRVVGVNAVDLPGTLPAGGSTTFSLDVTHDAFSFTPDVNVEVQSDSDPELLVTFSVNPTTLVYGGSVDVTGRTTPGADVRIQHWDQPSGSWENVHGSFVTAESDGSYSLTLVPAAGTTYRADSGENASVPAVIRVQDKVTLKASAKKTTVGKKIVLSGTAEPAGPGSKAQLQQKVGSIWVTIATVPVSASGAFTYRWTPKMKGTYVLRAYVEGQTLVFPGSSSSVTIAVK